MRRSVMPGLVLVLASVLVVLASAVFDLELEPVALLGLALGGCLAAVPDRTPLGRLAGFGVGVLLAWVGYLLRAGLLPDSAGGRAVAVALVLLGCVLLAAVAADRLPLWSLLLGVGALAGAYELTYTAAPPEVLTTSTSAVTALLLTVAAGFLALTPHTPRADRAPRATAAPKPAADDRLDDLMTEKTQ